MKVDQCLFGYDEGHRLLASSLSLEAETSLLTELSDLAPGTIFGKSEGYWTGFPVPSIKRYALLHTWPAPEMPRPGCVWTHALLIEPLLLESIADLSDLMSLMERPRNFLERDNYKKPLFFDLNKKNKRNPIVDSLIVRKLISALYEMETNVVEVTKPGELDESLFAVWSQQWPRLRRNFRFQTATSRNRDTSSSTRFDITAILTTYDSINSGASEIKPNWMHTAVEDVYKGEKGELRSFLWAYGGDVRRQRGSFRPLAEVNELNNNFDNLSGQELISVVNDYFPSKNDAIKLKQDLVDGVLATPEQAKFIKFILLNEYDDNNSFPKPSPEGIIRLRNLWPNYSSDILELIEISFSSLEGIGQSIFDNLIDAVDSKRFWIESANYPRVREIMIQMRPDLLMTSSYELDDKTLRALIPLVNSETVGLEDFISRLFYRNSKELACEVFNLFPTITVQALVLSADTETEKISDEWLGELLQRPQTLLQDEVMSLISKASILYGVADALGWLSPAIVSGGIGPWNAALENIKWNIDKDESHIFKCFLVSLAMISGGGSGLKDIERFYREIHVCIID